MSVFTGGEGRFIPLSESTELISNFRKANPDHPHAFFYGCELFYDLLEEPGCRGIRIYYAQDANGEPKMVLVGVTEDGSHILERAKHKSFKLLFRRFLSRLGLYHRRRLKIPKSAHEEGPDPGTSAAADNGKPCPPFCGPDDFGG